jgi:hypothetical protein
MAHPLGCVEFDCWMAFWIQTSCEFDTFGVLHSESGLFCLVRCTHTLRKHAGPLALCVCVCVCVCPPLPPFAVITMLEDEIDEVACDYDGSESTEEDSFGPSLSDDELHVRGGENLQNEAQPDDRFEIVRDRHTVYACSCEHVLGELNTPDRSKQIRDFGTSRSTDPKRRSPPIPSPQFLYGRIQIKNAKEFDTVKFPVAIAFQSHRGCKQVCIARLGS